MTPLLSAQVRRHMVDAHLTLDEDAQVTVLFGPSGSGKTTILRCIAGLDPLDDGCITFRGRVWSSGTRLIVPPRDRRVGYLFQDHALFPHLDVEANVGFGLRRMPRASRQEAVTAALTAARAEHLVDRPVPQLSGGEAQRVALARALAPRPDLLLLDEPLSALDTSTRVALRGEIRQVLLEQGIPTVVVTHDRAEALALGDRIAVVVAGRIRQVGDPADVFDRPQDPDVAAVLGVETALPGTVAVMSDGLARVSVGTVTISSTVDAGTAIRAGSSVLVCIRAEDVSIQLANTSSIASQRNQVDVTISAISAEGPLVRVDLDGPIRLTSYITRPALEDLGLTVGAPVVAVFKSQSVHLIEHARTRA